MGMFGYDEEIWEIIWSYMLMNISLNNLDEYGVPYLA